MERGETVGQETVLVKVYERGWKVPSTPRTKKIDLYNNPLIVIRIYLFLLSLLPIAYMLVVTVGVRISIHLW